MTGTITALMLLFDKAALVLFLGPDSPAVPLARHIQFLASWSFILFGVTIVLFGTMRAGGVVWVPLIVLAIAMFPARFGFYYGFRDMLGQDALWLAFPFGSSVSMLLAIWFYPAQGLARERPRDQPRARGRGMPHRRRSRRALQAGDVTLYLPCERQRWTIRWTRSSSPPD